MTHARQRLGAAGEAVAARFLEARGYRIVARNVRANRVEIDLIARRGALLVIVEVKTRASLRGGSAAEAVDTKKQHRLRRGARAWLACDPIATRGTQRTRFDVVTCLRIDRSATIQPEPREASDTSPIGAWAPCDTTPPDDRARWWIEHWEGAF